MSLPRAELPADAPRPPRNADPNAPAAGPGLLFGIDAPVEHAALVAIPLPYEATTSSRAGTVDGPRALVGASGQVDLLDPLAGAPWRRGLAVLPESAAIRALSASARAAAARARATNDRASRAEVDAAGRAVWDWLEDVVGRLLDTGRAPLVIGGEHGVSFGAWRAAAARRAGLGLLQLDAHADLRAAYEGFVTSHASVMRRALEHNELGRLVQVGLRDFCEEEVAAQRGAGGRAVWFTDDGLAERLLAGESFTTVAQAILAALPEEVWVSFDVDALEPSLCPTTGTPVPGGLSWREVRGLLGALRRSGKRVVGADLVEIGPDFWDGLVAAKALYLLAGIVGDGARAPESV